MDYDRLAFLAGVETGRALRRWKTPQDPLIKCVKQLYIHAPNTYTVTWNTQNSFTIEWTQVSDPVPYDDNGIVLSPNLFPVRITGESSNGSLLQYGVCTVNGSLPSIIASGAERVIFTNGLPDLAVINDDTETMRSVFVGTVFGPPAGTHYKVTISWDNYDNFSWDGEALFATSGIPILTNDDNVILVRR